MKLFQHINNRDVAVEVLRLVRVPGKTYCRIKVRWWNVGPHAPYCMGFEQWLTDSSIVGKKKQRQKYPTERWRTEWQPYSPPPRPCPGF